MIPLPEDISPDDIEQWFNRGIIMVSMNDDMVPCYYNGVRRDLDEDVTGINVETFNGEEIEVATRDVFGYWPRCGAVNCRAPKGFNIAVFVERMQRRQYRRTYNARSVHPTIPDAAAVTKKAGHQAAQFVLCYDRFTPPVFNPVYYTAPQALAMLNGEHASVAVSPTTVVTCGDGENRRIYYNGEFVAKYCPHGLVPLRARIPRAVSKRFGV